MSMAFLNRFSIDYSYGIVETHPFQNIGKKLFSFLSVCIDTNLMKFSLIITFPVFFLSYWDLWLYPFRHWQQEYLNWSIILCDPAILSRILKISNKNVWVFVCRLEMDAKPDRVMMWLVENLRACSKEFLTTSMAHKRPFDSGTRSWFLFLFFFLTAQNFPAGPTFLGWFTDYSVILPPIIFASQGKTIAVSV